MAVSEKSLVPPHQTTPRTAFIHNVYLLDSHVALASESTTSSIIDGDSGDIVDERLVKEEVAGIAGSTSADNHVRTVGGLPCLGGCGGRSRDGVVPEPLFRSRPRRKRSDETEDRNACRPPLTNDQLQQNNVVVVQGRYIPKEIHR